MPRTSQPAAFLFSPEDEERLAYRLGLLNGSDFTLTSGVEAIKTKEHSRFAGEHAGENLARQESEHVLRYEYLGL